MTVDKRGLLDLYEANGDETAFVEAKLLYEQDLAGGEDARLRLDYGYLLECHGRTALRHAIVEYERAIELDPEWDKPRYQAIAARAALAEPEHAIALYTHRRTASPGDVREYRFLADAFLAAREFGQARSVVDDGLRLVPNDPLLIEYRGDARAGMGDPDGALDDWRRALELDPENLSGLYSTAFLLEREQRIDEAIQAWQSIVDWSEARGLTLDTEWPKRELERLRAKPGPG